MRGSGKGFVASAMLAAFVCAGCPYILGVEGDFTTEGVGGAGASGTGASGPGGTGAGGPGGGNAGGAGGATGSGGAGGTGGGAGGGGGAVVEPVTLVEEPVAVDSVALDGTYVYWIRDPGVLTSEVWRAARAQSGSDKAEVATHSNLDRIAAGGGVLASAATSMVYRDPLPGSSAFSYNASQAMAITGLAMHTDRFYLAEGPRVHMVFHTQGMLTQAEYEEDFIRDVAVTPGFAYWTVDLPGATGHRVSWQVHGTGNPTNTGNYNTPGAADRIAAAEPYVCWTEPSAIRCLDTSMQQPFSASTIATVGAPTDVAVHGDRVYWTESGSGRVARAPVGGGATEDLATDETDPSSIAVDADYVFWTNRSAGQVRRMPRP